jgi:hypothetical protein
MQSHDHYATPHTTERKKEFEAANAARIKREERLQRLAAEEDAEAIRLEVDRLKLLQAKVCVVDVGDLFLTIHGTLSLHYTYLAFTLHLHYRKV